MLGRGLITEVYLTALRTVGSRGEYQWICAPVFIDLRCLANGKEVKGDQCLKNSNIPKISGVGRIHLYLVAICLAP